MTDVVAIEYELRPEDWIQAVAAHAGRSPLYRGALRRQRLLLGVIMALLVVATLLVGWEVGTVVLAGTGVVMIALLPTLARRAQRKHLRRYAREGVANGTFGRHRVTLTDDGIFESTEGHDLLIHWSAVERVEDAGGSLLIYNGPNSFLAVPTSAFPDRAAFERFSRRFFEGLEGAGQLESLADGNGREDDPDDL